LKRSRRTMALVAAIIMLCSSVAFAGAAAIVSPAANTIVYSDSLLVSVKVTEPKAVRVTVYEEKELINEQYASVKVANITEADLALIAVGPVPQGAGTAAFNTTTTSVSVLSDGSAVKSYTSFILGESASYTCTSQLGFYTKQINNITPGLYRIQVDTLDTAGAATETVNSLVAVKVKPVAETTNIFETPQTGALQFLQNLLKSIFR
jgi:hypothetical protein